MPSFKLNSTKTVGTSITSTTLRQFSPLTICLALCLLVGCARKGDRVDFKGSGVTPPEIATILADLAQNDATMRSMKAKGVFKLSSPKLENPKKFRGRLLFERPDRLYVEGSKLGGAIVVFKLVCVGSEFLMEFPSDQDQNFYAINGSEFDTVAFSVSPVDIVHEMFLPEAWAKVKKRSVHLIAYNEQENRVTLELRQRGRVRRVVELQQVQAESPQWVITRHVRYDTDGRALAITELTRYSLIEGALFPEGVDAFFPTEDTRMTFSLKDIRLNTTMAPATFDIQARAQALHLLDAQPVNP